MGSVDETARVLWENVKGAFDELTIIQTELNRAYENMRVGTANAGTRYKELMRDWDTAYRRYAEAQKKFNEHMGKV